MLFTELNLDPRLQHAIAERGYTELTPVQELTLKETLAGHDVAVQSQTGTGKTAAFLITILERRGRRKTGFSGKALIIAPTRELAVQIEEEARRLGRPTGASVGCFYGGVGYERQLADLRKGVDIAIGTPGRLLDLSERRELDLHDIGFLVIDEADRLFDMGFWPDLRKLISRLSRPNARQSMLFSATLNRLSLRLAADHMTKPVLIEVTPDRMTVETITQEIYHVKSHIKDNLLLGLLKRNAPPNALIFTNQKHKAMSLARMLSLNGHRCRPLTGDMTQSERLRIMDDFKSGRFPFLVATDIAARGLHIDGLAMVINYDLPQDFENYVHRIGRTARAGQEGKAISLACEKFNQHLYDIEKFIGMTIPVRTADPGLFMTDESLGHKRSEGKSGTGRSRSGSGSNKGGPGRGMRRSIGLHPARV
jgi:ATP-dependent RNA helicase RhlB